MGDFEWAMRQLQGRRGKGLTQSLARRGRAVEVITELRLKSNTIKNDIVFNFEKLFETGIHFREIAF